MVIGNSLGVSPGSLPPEGLGKRQVLSGLQDKTAKPWIVLRQRSQDEVGFVAELQLQRKEQPYPF